LLLRMISDVHNVLSVSAICHRAKSTFHQGFYTPLIILNGRWDDVSIGLRFGVVKN